MDLEKNIIANCSRKKGYANIALLISFFYYDTLLNIQQRVGGGTVNDNLKMQVAAGAVAGAALQTNLLAYFHLIAHTD